jgi:membrane fusion protein, multidrug efflux system
LDEAPKDLTLNAAKPRSWARVFLQMALVVVVSGLAVAGVVVGRQWWHHGRYFVTTDDAYVGARAAILSPKVSGYVSDILIADNAPVKVGDLIARIDAGDYKLALQSAQGQLEAQQAAVVRFGRQIEAQRALVAQANAQVEAAKAGAVRAGLELKRQSELALRKINTVAALDSAQANDLQAKAAVVSAISAVANAEANTAVTLAQQKEAEALVRLAEISVAKAERDLSFTEIRAPIDGILGNRGMQVGDYVQPTQRLASLVPIQSIFVEANFKETQVARLQVGQRVRISVDAHARDVIEGQVLSLAPASGAVFSLLPPDNATGNFTKIVQRIAARIALPPDAIARANLKPGMSVVVSVDTRTGPAAAAPMPLDPVPSRATSSIR